MYHRIYTLILTIALLFFGGCKASKTVEIATDNNRISIMSDTLMTSFTRAQIVLIKDSIIVTPDAEGVQVPIYRDRLVYVDNTAQTDTQRVVYKTDTVTQLVRQVIKQPPDNQSSAPRWWTWVAAAAALAGALVSWRVIKTSQR